MIAAFQTDENYFFELNRQKFEHDQQMFGIMMLGTCPTFYRMNITHKLSNCVKHGERPKLETELCYYSVPGALMWNYTNSLLYHDDAKHIAQCYEGLKQLISKSLN